MSTINDIPTVGQNFKYFSELEDYIRNYSIKEGFEISRSSRNHTINQFKSEFPFTNYYDVPRRGDFYCSECSPGFRPSNSKGLFKVHFLFQNNCYEITEVILEHRVHHIKSITDLFVQKKKQLSVAEIDFIMKHGGSINMPKITMSELFNQYFSKTIDNDLLYRLMSEARVNKYGDDPNSGDKLLQLGEKIKSDGGIFKARYNEAYQLESLYVMSANMLPYAKRFDECIQVDGTHSTNIHDFLLIQVVVIDNLGRSIPIGTIFSRSENSLHIIEGLVEFGFKVNDLNKRYTILTDEASFAPLVATHLNRELILCCFHYENKLIAISQTLKDKKEEFLKLSRKLIYEVYDNHQNLYQDIDELHKFSDDASFRRIVNSFVDNHKRICRTFVNHSITFHSYSSQRIEGMHSRIKNGVNLSKYNLFQLIQRQLNLEDQLIIESIQDISHFLEKKCYCSNFVSEIINQNLKNISGLEMKEEINNKLVIDEKNKISESIEITETTTCSCGEYVNLLISCKHILFAHVHKKLTLNGPCLINKRWLLNNHPLFFKAMENIGQKIPDEPQDITASSTPIVHQILHVPLNKANRINILRNTYDSLFLKATNQGGSLYRKLIFFAQTLLSTGGTDANTDVPRLFIEKRQGKRGRKAKPKNNYVSRKNPKF